MGNHPDLFDVRCPCLFCHDGRPESHFFHLNRHIRGSVRDRGGGNNIASLLQDESADVVVGRFFCFVCIGFVSFCRHR